VPEPESPSYEQLLVLSMDLAQRNEELAGLVSVLSAKVEALEVEVASLRRQVGRDSSNSSQPPSQDGPAAKGKAKAVKPAVPATGAKRRPGGQKGHRGTGLERVAVPDRSEQVEPAACGGCGGALGSAAGRVASTVQVFDIPAIAVRVTEYLMMARTCGCGHVTTAPPPSEVSGGPTCYGPNVIAAATFLASTDVLGLERTADMMSALLGTPVSTGFISRCLIRLDAALQAAGFEDALKNALSGADVLGTDESPAPITRTGKNLTQAGTEDIAGEDCHNPHVFTCRTMRAYTGGGPDLVWYGAAGTRTKPAITAFGILEPFAGVLVRDDYGGYLSYDGQLTGVQQCLSHMIRYLDDAYGIDPAAQVWTRQVVEVLRQAIHAVKTARAQGQTRLDPEFLTDLRHRYDQAVAVGISTNLSRPWHKGKKHPGLVLARRLKRKAEQVWLFTGRFDVPPTNNGSENSIRGYKIAVKVSGCWRTLATLRRHCRIRSYLTTARNHTRQPLDAIRDALTGHTWMPPTPA
jgi:transposase